jgi:hypothetical protein
MDQGSDHGAELIAQFGRPRRVRRPGRDPRAPIALGVMYPRAVLDPLDTRITALTGAAYSVRPATGPQPVAQPSCHRRTQLWVV